MPLSASRASTTLHPFFAYIVCALAAASLGLPPARALDPEKSVYQYNIQNWARQDGLPADKVAAITQSADGYIWIGTQNGLVRFDGLEFRSIPIDLPRARGQDVAMLQPARAGGVWFAINGGGVGCFDGRSFSPLDDARWDTRDVSMRTILETRDGAVWTGADRALGRWVENDPEASFFDTSTGHIISMTEGRRGRIWLGTEGHGLAYWANGTVTRIAAESLKDRVVFSVAEDANGRLWIGTEKGVQCLDASGQPVEVAPLPESVGARAIVVDRHGAVWVGTTAGLARYQNDTFTLLGKADGLICEFVTALFEDAEGSLWVGTQDGLSQISDLKFPIFTAKEGLTHAGGLTVSASRKGGIWATLTNGITYFDGRHFTNYTDPAIIPNNYIKLGIEARNGDFYWVDGDRTVNVLSNGKATVRYRNAEWTEAIAEDAESVILGLGSSLARIKDGRVQPYVFKNGVQPDFQWFDNFWVGRDDALWVACYAGIFRVKDGEFRQWSSVDGLSSNRVYYVFEDIDGHVWAGMATGLARLKDGQLKNVTAADGLFDNRIYAIVPDDHGFFWINSGRGIFRVSRQNLNDFADGKVPLVTSEPFDGLESVKSTDRVDQEYSGCRSLDGRIWFPSPWGLVMIDPDNFVRNTVPPPVYLEQILVNGVAVPDRSQTLLQVGDERIEFHFTALSFISPKRAQVRYQLEGFDRDWVNAGSRRSAFYNLEPGEYTFRVQAANADGVWNETGDTFAFELPPPFHQTVWFYALCTMGGVVGLFGAYGWKVRALKNRQRNLQRQNDMLEARVKARTDELANSLSLLKATLDSTADGILAVDLVGNVVSHNRHFAQMWGLDSRDIVHGERSQLVARIMEQVIDRKQFMARLQAIHSNPETEAFDVLELKDGRTIERYCKPQHIAGKCAGIVINFRDVTARKRSEAQLEQVHRQLLESSRQAGMAEVATSVLHNVGNVLNSVNVSTTLVVDKVRSSKVTYVPKVGAMLEEHAVDLPQFLTSDPKGQKIPSYLTSLGHQLLNEQHQIVEELDHLRKNVEHIKEIVAMQQSYAKVSGVAETLPICELVEDALRINAGALNRHEVEVVRDYVAQPVVTVERHKVMQVLVNLVRNAKYACDESGRGDKRIVARVTEEGGRVKIAVIDNGVGIPPENLTRIFSHGFTTKKEGHGFGLHSGALVAREMGGSLVAHSEGPGRGATFILELPADHVP